MTTNNNHNEKDKALSIEELRTLFQTAREVSSRDFALVYLAYFGALRSVEIERMARRDLFMDNGAFWVKVHCKGRKEKDRVTYIHDEVLEALREHWRVSKKDCEFMFCGQKGKSLSTRAIRHIVQNLFKKAGLEGHSTHHLRHSAATNAALMMISIEDIQNLLHHERPSTTRHYARAGLRKRVRKVGEALVNQLRDNVTVQFDDSTINQLINDSSKTAREIIEQG